MEENKLENFNSFIEESGDTENKDKDEKIQVEIIPISEVGVSDEAHTCPYCDYLPRKHAKDKAKAIRDHIRKHHPEKYSSYCGSEKISEKKKKDPTFLESLNQVDNASLVEEYVDEDGKKQKLIEDLDVLQIKFPDLYKCPSYSYPESSVEHLQRIKNTYMRLINDKLTTKLAFNCLVAFGKGAETISDSLGVCDIDGFAGNIQDNYGELSEIIQELIDSQVIDVSCIGAPEKLGLALLNIGIRTAEANKVKKKSINLENAALS